MRVGVQRMLRSRVRRMTGYLFNRDGDNCSCWKCRRTWMFQVTKVACNDLIKPGCVMLRPWYGGVERNLKLALVAHVPFQYFRLLWYRYSNSRDLRLPYAALL